MKKSYEEWRDIAIPDWKEVRCNGWNDPNEGWYYKWCDYTNSPSNYIEDLRITNIRALLVDAGWAPPENKEGK